MNSAFVIVASIIGALGGLGGAAALVTAFAKRPTLRADAEVRLSEQARQWVDEFQQDATNARLEAKEARTEATAARREATEAHIQMQAIRREAQWLAARLQDLRRAILDPNATLERLRAMAGPDRPGNGTV